MKRCLIVCLAMIFSAAVIIFASSVSAASPVDKGLRKKAQKAHSDGNYKDALLLFEKLTLSPDTDPVEVGQDLTMAVSCLGALNRRNETDRLREKAVMRHPKNWRLLTSAALSYFSDQHYGYIVAGEFHRGYHRGGGRYVNSTARDRARALQLMNSAMESLDHGKVTLGDRANFHMHFARILMGDSGYSESWRLLHLTDLSRLPDYEEGYFRQGSRGAPGDAEGNPVFHKVPKRFHAAKSDGERWRWMLERAMAIDPGYKHQALTVYADFLYHQFGVQTMARGFTYFYDDSEEKGDTRKQTFQLDTLAENETLSRLSSGIKRFFLPPDADFISIYKQIAEGAKGYYSKHALDRLASIFENRRQYDRSAQFWQRGIKKHGPGPNNTRQKRLDQILGNWGQFESVMTHAAGEKVSVNYRFRNGRRVRFEAKKIKIGQLLEDVKRYLESNPRQLDTDRLNIGDIGYRMVEKNETRYIGPKTAQWHLNLTPRKNHFDRRITVKIPIETAGAYLLTARMDKGNTSQIIIWINDTVIVKKQLEQGSYFFVADAVNGQPLSDMKLEFFGFRQEKTDWQKVLGRRYNILTTRFSKNTDGQGQTIINTRDMKKRHRWIITANNKSGRLAYLGFAGIWHAGYHQRQYNQIKAFAVTDRPVYRPDHAVKFKLWVRQAKYDQNDTSSFAGRRFPVRISNPHGEKIFEKTITADEYGGLTGEYRLPGDAALGVYRISVPGRGGGYFRVEEYKKPEFKVSIDAPTEPVMLGEKFEALIKAEYYHGAPVTRAKVKYTVMRSSHQARWFPPGIWDWFYGPGYWWFTDDYRWYPGWETWGCKRPLRWWLPRRRTPPELVAEAEGKIGPDGTLKINIDTALAKAMHGDKDHVYNITAEVTDLSRRTIVGRGRILAARKPFKVYAWVDRGHYRIGDVIQADFSAHTLDRKPIQGEGRLRLLRIEYSRQSPVEREVQSWNLDTDDEGRAHIQIKAAKPGQYRLSYLVKDKQNHTVEGGYVFCIRGQGSDDKDFRFNHIELIPDQRQYAPGETVRLMMNTNQENSTVVLFLRPANGVYRKPKIFRIRGKSEVEKIKVVLKDMPNFFVEAFTVSQGKLYTAAREIIVPPRKRILNVDILPALKTYQPGEEARIKIRLTDLDGNPFIGSTVMSVYDKSLEYISGGTNIADIKEFFWKWRRRHHLRIESNLNRRFRNRVNRGHPVMKSLGVFGHMVADETDASKDGLDTFGEGRRTKGVKRKMSMPRSPAGLGDTAAAPAPMMEVAQKEESGKRDRESEAPSDGFPEETIQPAVRKAFADTAFWHADLQTDKNGYAEVVFKMPENLTGWMIKTWAMGHGTKVGQGAAEIVTTKNLLLRMQAPRFFVEKDEVVLSANIHNYLETQKNVRAVLELDGNTLVPMEPEEKQVSISPHGEQRVDWRVKVAREGEAVVRMKALSDEESDAMEMRFPVYVHGMLKTESFSGVIRRNQKHAVFTFSVPVERRIDQSRLEIRYTPSLAGAMVDALPYLAEYPYGCTEQTLNRFLPTVITQKIINEMGVDLAALKEKVPNLNAQETGDDRKRAEQWRQWKRNPVFDADMVDDMVKKGIRRLTNMQLSDGGWGWFSGWGERAYPHTTALVVQGLQTAARNGVSIPPVVLKRGIDWLSEYQEKQVRRLINAKNKKRPSKANADNLDAFVYQVLVAADRDNNTMQNFLYRDRNKLSVYGKAMYGLALFQLKQNEKLQMILSNIEQYLVEDKENQTFYLNLPNQYYWWYWYGGEFEAHAGYLKLLARIDPKSEKAAGLVKYLLNNRKNATYWKSTRDTALCIEALAEYLRASGEERPDMTLHIFIDDKKIKEVRIKTEDLFSFDNKIILTGKAIKAGQHEVKVVREGTGPVYFNAYLTNFTLEDFITQAGLEIKVHRKYYKLNRVEKTVKTAGDHGQPLNQNVEKFERQVLANLTTIKSGDLVEIELEIESKNDYEYLVFEDMKAAGFEPVEVRSGYTRNGLSAYMELRDERVCFFMRHLARGKHSIAYRMRAEIPGRFSALPTRAYAMYAPELKANSDEIKLRIEDEPFRQNHQE
jgi:uncharacterized protein YfaS (alpha-2-macroglobulin family)